jgi:hypothetical protein
MKHRHLQVHEDDWGIDVIESILERGRASDVLRLFRKLRQEPFGETAENALVAAEHLQPYGYRYLIPNMLKIWRERSSA